jgi:ribosomal protein L29
MKDANRKVILRLKEVRNQKNLSYQDIVDACETQGEAISLSTVRRIFAKGSEDGPDYRTYTINAIFHAVIGTEDLELTAAEEAALTDPAKEAIVENAALKAVVELRDATIEELNRQIKDLNADIAELKTALNTANIKLDATIDVFRIAMESLGKSAVN